MLPKKLKKALQNCPNELLVERRFYTRFIDGHTEHYTGPVIENCNVLTFRVPHYISAIA
jgi:hypothetical protein